MKKWLLAFGGLLLIAALAILGRDGRQLKKVEAQRDALIATGIKTNLIKADKLNKKAEKSKTLAKDAAIVGRAALDKTKDQTMRELLAEWSG